MTPAVTGADQERPHEGQRAGGEAHRGITEEGQGRGRGSKGAAGRTGASGPAGPRRRRGRRARSHRRGRVGMKARRRQRNSVPADSASAPQTSFCGVHVSVTVKSGPPSACRSAAVICQPLAKLSVSCEPPRSTACDPAGAPAAGGAVAFHPLFDALAEHELERWRRTGHLRRLRVDVARGLGHGRGGAGLGRRQHGGALRRREPGGPGPATGGRVQRELVEVPPRAGQRLRRSRSCVPRRRLDDVGAGARA